MGWVVLKKISEGRNIHHRIINGWDGDALVVFVGRSQDESTDSSESIDSEHFNCVSIKLLIKKIQIFLFIFKCCHINQIMVLCYKKDFFNKFLYFFTFSYVSFLSCSKVYDLDINFHILFNLKRLENQRNWEIKLFRSILLDSFEVRSFLRIKKWTSE